MTEGFTKSKLDRCISCGYCLPACPAGVEYGVLLEEMREMVWQGKNRPFIIRGLLTLVKTKWRVRFIGLLSPMAHNRNANTDLHLMLGCFERALFPKISRTLSHIAPEVSISKNQGCCGALHAHNGELKRAKVKTKVVHISELVARAQA